MDNGLKCLNSREWNACVMYLFSVEEATRKINKLAVGDSAACLQKSVLVTL